jgi:hypothetical protein
LAALTVAHLEKLTTKGAFMTNRITTALVLIGSAAALAACSDAQMASSNLSKAADNFEINRRVVFYNGITGDYILTIEGLCSQEPSENGKKLAVTCKTGPGAFKKHFLGLSDNVTYFSEQIEAAAANTYHYRVIFKPAAIIPTIELK